MTPQSLYTQGTTAFADGRLEDAVNLFGGALDLNRDFIDARVTRGRAFAALRDFNGAEKDFSDADQQIARPPAELAPQVRIQLGRIQADIEFCRGLIDLVSERFDQGWQRYRAFYRTPGFPLSQVRTPLWLGEAVRGPLLIYADQGLGDGVQFSRYVSRAVERCPRLHLLCDQPLGRLLTLHHHFERVWPLGEWENALRVCHAYAPLTSLPGTFREFLDGRPSGEPYIKAPDALAARYRDMVTDRSVLHVGVVWKGSPKNQMDKIRSFDPSLLSVLARVEGVRFYSLQREAMSGEADAIAPSERLVDLRQDLNQPGWDILDTASIVQNLDLVVTCDTMVAHLAGALGISVWVPIANTPDWRWGLKEEFPAWYRSMRLFRQEHLRDWGPVFARMAEELPRFIEARRKI